MVDQMARVRGRREYPLISSVMRPVLTDAESAVMHIISGFPGYNRKRYDSKRYTQYWLWYDTDPISTKNPESFEKIL